MLDPRVRSFPRGLPQAAADCAAPRVANQIRHSHVHHLRPGVLEHIGLGVDYLGHGRCSRVGKPRSNAPRLSDVRVAGLGCVPRTTRRATLGHSAQMACSPAAAPTAAPANDKTGSIFISKDKFGAAAREVGLDAAVSDALWAKLCDSSGQRIIAGATLCTPCA